MPEVVNTSYLSTTLDADDDRETMICIDGVSMMFNMASAKLNSLKEYAIAAARHELAFKEFWALNDISFEVKKGDVYGIMGTNGSGKSTMLKIIAGVLEPTRGTCTVKGNIAPLIELGAGFDLELTARENIFLNGALLGYSKKFIQQHFDEIVEFSEVKKFLDMPMKNYSSGMVARIAFAIATVMVPDVLIVDEVLSVGDFMFRQKCERRIQELIRDHGVTVLIVSHSTDQVRRLCNKVIWIEKGHTRMIGNAQEVCDIYQLVGGRTGDAASERAILDTLEDREVDTSPIACQSIFGDTKHGSGAKLAQPQEGPCDTVVLHTADEPTESMIAAGLAGMLGAKTLNCPPKHLPDTTTQALSALQPRRVVFAGTPHNLDAQALAAQLPCEPEEVLHVSAGSNLDLGLAVLEFGKQHGTWGDTCVLSPEFCIGDQFALLPAAMRLHAPLFFVNTALNLDERIIDAICTNFKRVLVLAGEDALPSELLAPAIEAGVTVQRFIATSEYEANQRIFDWMRKEFPGADTADSLVVVAPRHPDDAFCVGSFAVRTNSLVLLDNPNNLDYVASAVQRIREFDGSVRKLTFIGDPTVFNDVDTTILLRTAASAYWKRRERDAEAGRIGHVTAEGGGDHA